MKGRPRDPTRSRRRTGHRRKPDEAPQLRALPAPEPSPGPEPPEHLNEQAKETWSRITAAIQEGGIPVRELDAYGIELMVTQLTRARQAAELVDKYGLPVQKVSGDVGASPFLKAERDAAAMFLRYAEQYGLTVAARMRLGLMQLAARTLTEALSEDLEGGES